MKNISKILAIALFGMIMNSAYASSDNNAQENVQQTKSFQTYVVHNQK